MDVTDAAPAQHRPIGLVELLRIPLRRWRTVLVTAVLISVAAGAYLWLVPATYTATTVVLVRPVVTDPFSYPAGGADRAVNMTAESGVATSNDVIDKVIAITGRDVEEITEALKVEAPVGGQLLRFSYAATSEHQAVAGANGAAEMYLHLRKGMYEEQRTSVLKSYDDTIALVTAQRTTTQKSLPSADEPNTSSPRISALLDQMRSLNDQLAQLAEQRSKIASADLSPGSITSAARAPVPSNHDAALLIIIAAVLGGALLGGLAAFIRESLDRRVRSAADAAEVINAPLLGTIHRPRRGEPSDSDLRYLALALHGWYDQQPSDPLVILSSDRDEGRSQVSAGLAAVLAEAGHQVRLGATAESIERLRRLLLVAQRRAVPAPPAQAVAPAQPVSVPPANSMDDTVQLAPVRKPRPFPSTDPNNGAVYQSATMVEQTQPVPADPAESNPMPDGLVREPGPDWPVLRIGSGGVRLNGFDIAGDSPSLMILDAPAAAYNDIGVRAATKGGFALLVAARDRTRTDQLDRLVNRLRATGVEPIGFVMTGDGHE